MKTILLADDSKHIREFCKSALEAEGYRVVAACNGAEAARFAQIEHFDLAILDIHMPVMDGLAAAQRIRGTSPAIPILFFTSNHEASTSNPVGELTDTWLEKTDDLLELKRAVARILAMKRSGA